MKLDPRLRAKDWKAPHNSQFMLSPLEIMVISVEIMSHQSIEFCRTLRDSDQILHTNSFVYKSEDE